MDEFPMLTKLQLEGANCSLCLNDIIDQLREVEGVNSVTSSIAEGCLAIDHDDELTRSDLIAWIGSSLHGVTMASNEIVMTSINPSISALPCEHAADDDSRTP
jgi:copper chaperone CopZ